MAGKLKNIIDGVVLRRGIRRATKMAIRAETMDLATLRRMRVRAREIRRRVDKMLFVADSRLTLPLVGSNAIHKPLHTDWAHRPELWRGPITPPGLSSVENKAGLGSEVTVFHDCRQSELTLRQMRNSREEDLAPFGLRMDVFGFDGSFLSVVIQLPEEASQGLTRNHVLRLAVAVDVEHPLEIFARLNIKNGPNTEQIVREIPAGVRETWVEFDLAYSKLNEKRVERMWIELIFEGPEMNQIEMRDVTMTRRLRAEL